MLTNCETIDNIIVELVNYAEGCGLIGSRDRLWAVNNILDALKKPSFDGDMSRKDARPLNEILDALTDHAVESGIIDDNMTSRELFDTELMGRLTPRPSDVARTFSEKYGVSPKTATDWYYKFSGDTNYIRRDRIAKDVKWLSETSCGNLEITINLSKPEKDPRAIAAAKLAPQSGYPKCLLCAENEGYAGRLDHPARQNHRLIPVELHGESWFLQYSPYVYYNEHCIVLNSKHVPMVIDRTAFEKLLEFIGKFPHYFVGSNADLPIVGGSILSHEHFQGGAHEFPMAKAPIRRQVSFRGFDDVTAGIVRWPMSVIRLRSPEPERLAELADKLLRSWRGYTDKDAFIFAETNGEPHNTVTPIARRRGDDYELDLVLRNNITTDEYPLGVYHPHQELHHIKKENIGLIEVMGLAVLPARLKSELAELSEVLISGGDVGSVPSIAKHADWAAELREKYDFTRGSTDEILKLEVGRVFEKVLEHAGVYKSEDAFMKFIESVK